MKPFRHPEKKRNDLFEFHFVYFEKRTHRTKKKRIKKNWSFTNFYLRVRNESRVKKSENGAN